MRAEPAGAHGQPRNHRGRIAISDAVVCSGGVVWLACGGGKFGASGGWGIGCAVAICTHGTESVSDVRAEPAGAHGQPCSHRGRIAISDAVVCSGGVVWLACGGGKFGASGGWGIGCAVAICTDSSESVSDVHTEPAGAHGQPGSHRGRDPEIGLLSRLRWCGAACLRLCCKYGRSTWRRDRDLCRWRYVVAHSCAGGHVHP